VPRPLRIAEPGLIYHLTNRGVKRLAIFHEELNLIRHPRIFECYNDAVSKHLYIIAGPNGAGKTTFAREFLPRFARCNEFVNADLIASGLAPFSPQSAAMQSGRLVLRRIHDLAAKGTTFGFETTLAGRSYISLLKRLQKSGYKLHLYFLWLPSVELAIKRVEDRVRQGGHSVPVSDIRRRFDRGLRHLFKAYLPLIDEWVIFDNSGNIPKEIAFGAYQDIKILDESSFEKLRKRTYGYQ
jgi:predicted ABC-type ATPase